jgi:hypothetical protein
LGSISCPLRLETSWGTFSSFLPAEEGWAASLSDLGLIFMAEDLRRMALVSGLKLKSYSGDIFSFPFLEVMMVEGRKKWRRFYKNTRKKDLVYLVNEFFFNVKLLSFCKILKIPKSGDLAKKKKKV